MLMPTALKRPARSSSGDLARWRAACSKHHAHRTTHVALRTVTSMIIYSSPRFTEHTPPPGHPERPERGEVFEVVAAEHRRRGGVVREPRPATREELARVHTEAYLDQIAATAGRPTM